MTVHSADGAAPTTFVRSAPTQVRADNAGQARHFARHPIRVGFIVGTFTFGGSETETVELVYGADPARLKFVGIAVRLPLALPPGEPPPDGSFPPIYTVASDRIDGGDPRVKVVASFEDAVDRVLQSSDVVLTWGVPRLQEHLPDGELPPIVVVSKDSGEWAKGFLHPNSLLTRYLVANSTMAATAFPARVRSGVKVIHDGINPRRVAPRISREAQRALWGFGQADKIVGYLGRIEADKGVSKTVAGVARLGPQWKAVFIGANPNCRFTAELAALCEHRIPGRHRLLGWCHDVGSALAAFDVFCQPSEHEGFSNSLAEAWLASVPTVYTAGTGALPDLGGLGVAVSPNADGREMAAAIARAYGNTTLAEKARAVVEENYLVTHNVQRWTDYIESLRGFKRRTRVMVIAPKRLARDALLAAAAGCSPCRGVDLCAALLVGEAAGRLDDSAIRIERTHGCPVWEVCAREQVEFAAQYTRPELIAAWGLQTIAHVLPAGHRVATIDLFNPLTTRVPMLPAVVPGP